MKRYTFRGKDIATSKWVFGSLVQHYDGEAHIISDFPFVCEQDTNLQDFRTATVRVDPKTIGLYTFLKDKFNNKIFEGDILQTSFGRGRGEVFFIA